MESHDEERIMYKTLTYGAYSGNYNTQTLQTALKRMELDALFLLTVPGPKMIWQFGELGYDISIDNGGRTSVKPLKWDYFLDPDRHRLYLIYKLLNNLRKTQPVFGTENYSYSFSTPLKQLQLIHPSMKVNILGNFGVIASSIDPLFPQTGKWYEYFSADSINVLNVNDPIGLQPGEYRLYTTKKLESPKYILGVENPGQDRKEHIAVVYPNPSSEIFNFEIKSPVPTPASVSIYDISGRMIRQLRTNISSDGIQSVKWDGKLANGSLASAGIYIVHIATTARFETLKIIKN
jgi:hypothetical protein